MAKMLIIGENNLADGYWHAFKNHHALYSHDIWSLDKEKLQNWCDVAIVCAEVFNAHYSLTQKQKIENYRCDTTVMEDIIINCNANLFIIATPVEPGITDRLRETIGKRIINITCLEGIFIFGGPKSDTKYAIELFKKAYERYRYIQVDSKTSEVFKFVKEAKETIIVSYMKKIEECCELDNIDIDEFRELWMNTLGEDPLKIVDGNSNREIVKKLEAYIEFVTKKQTRLDI